MLHNLTQIIITPTMLDDFGKYLLIAFIVGFGFLAWRAWHVKQASPQWPYVEGEVLTSRAFARNETADQRGTPTHEWLTEVSYSYTVNGIKLKGNRLRAFGLNHFDEAQAQQEIAPFPVGQRVKVYYDPANPASSVLIPG
ncbi:MAG: DUF3592 domain-containing protein [Aquabacterium sp.]|nr:DUF3592 domain-containing protein [Aquabacterium sp.]